MAYRITITNQGPQKALNVVATDSLPFNVNIMSITPSQGSFSVFGRTVTCNLGTLQPNASATVDIVVRPVLSGLFTNSVSVATSSTDSNPANNAATVVSTVNDRAPQIAITGVTLVSEQYSPPNGTVDPGEILTVSFTMANIGTADATNLVAALQSSGGITLPGPAQAYGSLTAGGPSASRTFTFTASPSASGTVLATFNLTTGTQSLGSVSVPLSLPLTTIVANSQPVTIPEAGAALQYPATINVSGLTGLVSKVAVTLSNLNHSFPDDLDILLVGPNGRRVVLMSDAGGSHSLSNVTIHIEDSASVTLPDASRIHPGSYKPTNYEAGDVFPGVPPGNPDATLGSFNGINPNGTWSLYIVDDTSGDGGQLTGGWSLAITTVNPINPAANIEVAISPKTGSAFVGQEVTYLIGVTNHGPAAATSLSLTNIVPTGMSHVSSATTHGAVAFASGAVSGNLGSLAPGESALVTVILRADATVTATNTVSARAAQSDLNLLNNSDTATLTIFPPLPPVLHSLEVLTNSNFQFVLTGQPGTNYIVLASTNFVNWIPISTNTAGNDGTVKVIDSSNAGLNTRYYRALRAP